MGILRQPGPVASCLRAPWLIMLMWFVGAIYAACAASNLSELATMIPRAGGFFVHAHEAMGDYAGFAVGWSDFLAKAAPASYCAMAAFEFLQRLVPAVALFAPWLDTGAILAFAAMQWFGVRRSARVQQVASASTARREPPGGVGAGDLVRHGDLPWRVRIHRFRRRNPPSHPPAHARDVWRTGAGGGHLPAPQRRPPARPRTRGPGRLQIRGGRRCPADLRTRQRDPPASCSLSAAMACSGGAPPWSRITAHPVPRWLWLRSSPSGFAARPFRVFAYPALTLLTLAGSLAFSGGRGGQRPAQQRL